MNKYRLNQILEILLFPVMDSELGKEDPLLTCYKAYREYMQESHRIEISIRTRADCEKEYKKARKKLVEYLVERNHGRVKSEDDVQMLLDLYYSMTELECEMEYLARVRADRKYANILMENISSCYIKSLARISCSLITYRDGVAAIRQWVDKDVAHKDLFSSSSVYSKIEIWNLLCRFTAPDLYIVIAAIENKLGLEALYEQKPNIALADKLLVKSIQKGVAENHLHFSVGFDYEIVWLYYTNLNFVEKQKAGVWKTDIYKQLQLALFRYFAANYLEQEEKGEGFGVWLRNPAWKELFEIIYKLYVGEYIGEVSKECQEVIYKLYAQAKKESTIRECDYLMDKIYFHYIEYKTSSEFILLYKCYRYLKETEADTFFARVFLQYVRLKNEYFYTMFQQHMFQGLEYFQKKFHLTKNSMEKNVLPTEDMMVEVFRSQAKIANLRKLEIRVAPLVDGYELDHFSYEKSSRSILKQLSEQICMILKSYRRYILEGVLGVRWAWDLLKKCECDRLNLEEIINEIRMNKVTIPTLGIIFHFIKEDYLEDICGQYCWRSVCGDKDLHSSHRLLRRLYTTNIAIALEELRSNIPKLSEYIVGIDAASDENAVEPWMFSSTYKTMRSRLHTKPVLEIWNTGGFEKIQNIGFTYHVGEDFRHIVSGLRHVDEVLEHFSYKAGDRLGHALALGIDIEQWGMENEVVPIPIQEHLENLLWTWGVNVCEGIDLPIQLEVLEDRINNIIWELYEEPEFISIKMLYRAYQMKFDASHEKIAHKLLKGEINKRGFCLCRNTEECFKGWTAEKLLMTNYCPVYEGAEKYARVSMISVSKEDITLYKKIQEHLIHKVEEMGIFIETNPTSNLTIGDVSHVRKHPIFHLNRRGNEMGNKALVTINSDDPAVFNTNIENELAYIYYAAEAKGIAKSEILEWIDRIREYGIEASFVQKEKGVEQILSEIENILEEIRRLRI